MSQPSTHPLPLAGGIRTSPLAGGIRTSPLARGCRTPRACAAATRAVALLVAGSLVATAACDQGGPAGAPHLDELPTLRLTEEVRIGSLEDPVEGFTDIRNLQVSEAGDVYVLDRGAMEVRVFSPDGEHLRTVGGRGAGPGEFRNPAGMGLLGDTLWVMDLSLQRLSWFGPDGELLSTTRGDWTYLDDVPPGYSVAIYPGVPQPDGLIRSRIAFGRFSDGPIAPVPYPVVRYDREGTVVDTLRWDTVAASEPTFRIGGREAHAPYLFPRPPTSRAAGDGRVSLDWRVPEIAAEGLLQVVSTGPAGDTVFHTSLAYEPEPTPGYVQDSIVESRLGTAPQLGVSEGELRRALPAAVEVPDHRPPLRSHYAGDDGTVWIELNTPSLETADWVVLGPDGEPLGRLTLPLRASPRHSDLPTAWVVELDEFEVPWLVRVRVEGELVGHGEAMGLREPGRIEPAAPDTVEPAGSGVAQPAAPGTAQSAAPGTAQPAAPGVVQPAARRRAGQDPNGAEARPPVILFGDELDRELSHFGLPPETALQASEWLGMHPAGDGFELRPTQVHIETWPDDRLDDYVLFRVTSDPPGPRLLFSGIDDLAPGPAVTVGEHSTLSVWEADRTVDEVTYTLNGVSYRVRLTATHGDLCDAEVTLHRGEASQILFRVQGEGAAADTAEAPFQCDEPHFRIHWAGDLDGDGALDLLVTFSPKYSHHPRQLFLSGGAAGDAGAADAAGGAAGVAGAGASEPGAPGSQTLVKLVAEYLPY